MKFSRHLGSFGTLTAALALVLFTACGGGGDSTGPNNDNGNGSGDNTAGTFTGSISGDLDVSLDGTAAWGTATDPNTGQTSWVIVLATTGGSGITIVGVGDSEISATTYNLADATQNFDTGTGASIYLSQNGANTFTGASTGGTVDITSTSGGNVAGTMNIQATGFALSGSSPQEETVTVTGSFNAINSSNVNFPGF